MSLARLCAVDELEEDGGVRAPTEFGVIAVWKVGEAIYATADRCTHGAASLVDDGFLEEFTIICGLHEGAFDIRTGVVVALPCTQPIRSYPVHVRNGLVYAELDDQ